MNRAQFYILLIMTNNILCKDKNSLTAELVRFQNRNCAVAQQIFCNVCKFIVPIAYSSQPMQEKNLSTYIGELPQRL